MSKRIVVVAHGIGDHVQGFHEEWEEAIYSAHPGLKDRIEVRGLHWDDLQDEVREKFPLYSDRFELALEAFGIDDIKDKLKQWYDDVDEHLMDVLSFLFLHDLRERTKAKAQMRLYELLDGERSPILVGHSLGGVLFSHLLWDQRKNIGTMLAEGLILMGCPLGMESPTAKIKDLIETMDFYESTPRAKILRRFVGYFAAFRSRKLSFLINENDLAASDVKYDFCDGSIDPIDPLPIRTGFSSGQLENLEAWCPGCVSRFRSPDEVPQISRISEYHAVGLYLARPEFGEAMEAFLA